MMYNGKQIKYCYHAPEKMFELDDVEYYASSAMGVSEFTGDLVVNFTKSPNLPPAGFAEIFAEFDLNFEEEILVPWPDYGLPKVKISFWKTLHKFIRSRGWHKVCFHCQAGHGRTGTALASMLIVHTGLSAYDAVASIREIHCSEAVESFEQCRYLQLLDDNFNGRNADDENFPIPSNMFDKIKDPEKKISGIDDVDEEDLNNIIWEDEIEWENEQEEEDGNVETSEQL